MRLLFSILLIVLTINVPAPIVLIGPPHMAPSAGFTLKDSNTGTVNLAAQPVNSLAANKFRATKFTAGSTYTAAKIELLLAKGGTTGLPTGNITLFVYADNSGSCCGALLATSSSTVNAASLPVAGSQDYFGFLISSAFVNATQYWLAVTNSAAVDVNSFVGWYAPDAFVNGGVVVSADGVTWNAGSSRRANFKTYTSP